MAQSMKDLLECSICTEEKHELRMLQCNHSFCSECLQNIVSNCKLCCPVCRKTTTFPSVQDLPVDFKHQCMKDFAMQFTGSGKDHLCGLCRFHKKIESAKIFCEDCIEFFCEHCSICHTENACTSGHKTVTLDSTSSLAICSEHTRAFQAICFTCNKCICAYCLLLGGHENHDIKSAKEENTRKYIMKSFKECLDNVKDMKIACSQDKELIDTRAGLIKTMHNTNIKTIQSHATDAVAQIRKEESRLLKEISVLYDRKCAEAERAVLENDRLYKQLETWSSAMQSNLGTSSEDCLSFTILKQG